MRKITKLILGMLLISGLVFAYGKFNSAIEEDKVEQYYSYISLSFPGNEMTSIQIKKTPESQCEKWRSQYFSASSEQCKECTALANDCRKEIPEIYRNAFEQKNIGVPYIFKPYNYPEITILDGLPDGTFSQICDIEKKSLETTKCFE